MKNEIEELKVYINLLILKVNQLLIENGRSNNTISYCKYNDSKKNKDYDAIKKLISENSECVRTQHGDFLKKDDVINCLNIAIN